jgi:hypothetical protein
MQRCAAWGVRRLQPAGPNYDCFAEAIAGIQPSCKGPAHMQAMHTYMW